MPEIEEKVNELEALLGKFIIHTDLAITKLSNEVHRKLTKNVIKMVPFED